MGDQQGMLQFSLSLSIYKKSFVFDMGVVFFFFLNIHGFRPIMFMEETVTEIWNGL